MTSAPYLALTWRSEAAADTAAVAGDWLRTAGWRLAATRAGLSLWRRPDRPVAVRDLPDGGLLIGHRVTRAEAPPSRPEGVEARGRRLCAGGFGAYLALLRDEAEARWWAFRDPCGAVEALTWTWADLAVIASSLELAPGALRPARLALDWTVIADVLRRPVSAGAAIALRDVGAVAPGELRPVGAATGEGRQLWRPLDWAREPADPEGDASEGLRDAVQASVSGLLQPYGRVVVELSGGFDSSLVCAAIVRADLRDRVVTALHYVGDRAEADERRWAEAVAASLGLRLEVVQRPPGATFEPEAFADLARDARPPYAALDTVRDADTSERLRRATGDALVSGKGGDSNFFQMPAPAVLADLLRARGGAALSDPLGPDMARWLRRSLWSVWREALRPPPVWAGEGTGRFEGWAMRELPLPPPHPWLAGLEAAPPGKRVQVGALVATQQSAAASRRTRAADLVQPLLAQPVMELCLSLPSWRLLEGGRDRALARRAFAAWLPASVVRRRAKGALTSIYARRLAASLEAVRAHLLDGVLTNAGLLDREAVEAALEEEALMRSTAALDLVTACALESWVRYWQTRVSDADPRPRTT